MDFAKACEAISGNRQFCLNPNIKSTTEKPLFPGEAYITQGSKNVKKSSKNDINFKIKH